MMRRVWETVFYGFALVSAGLVVISVICLLSYLLKNGWKALGTELIFGSVHPLDALLLKRQVFDGLLPALFGTLVLVVFSVSMAVPLGVLTGIFMAEFASPTVKKTFSLFYDVLAGIPSIVVGLFGFSLTVFLHRYVEDFYPCLLVSACSLSFLVLPYLIRSTQIALEGIDHEMRVTALALGASRVQNLIYVLIPRCLSGIVSGIVLSIGRCAEDTAVIMLTGVVATSGVPRSLWGNYEALPFYIYYISSQFTDASELARGYGAAILLVLTCMGLFFLSFVIKGKLGRMAHRFL